MYYLHIEESNRWYLAKGNSREAIYFTTFREGRKACEFLNELINRKSVRDFEDFSIKQGQREYEYYLMDREEKVCYLTTYSEAKSLLGLVEKILTGKRSLS